MLVVGQTPLNIGKFLQFSLLRTAIFMQQLPVLGTKELRLLTPSPPAPERGYYSALQARIHFTRLYVR